MEQLAAFVWQSEPAADTIRRVKTQDLPRRETLRGVVAHGWVLTDRATRAIGAIGLNNVTSAGRRAQLAHSRIGAATVDYVLGLGVVMPLLLIAIPASRRIMQLVYEFAATMVAWPFM